MAFKLSELLNPAPASDPSSPARKDSSPPSQTSDTRAALSSMQPPAYNNAYAPATTIYEAADALTALANGAPLSTTYAHSNSLPYESHNDRHSSPTSYSDARRMSAYGVPATPVEPSPPTDGTKRSPTLDQYHHGSKSPEEQRRQSMASRSSPPPRLAPIQSLTGALNNMIDERQSQNSTFYGHDTSRILSPPANYSAQNGLSQLDYVAQHREPDYVRDEPTLTQIRQTSTGPDIDTHAAAVDQDPIPRPPEPSPSSRIKAETSHTPPEPKPYEPAMPRERTKSVAEPTLDPETLKAVAELKNEHGLRGASRDTSAASPQPPQPSPANPRRLHASVPRPKPPPPPRRRASRRSRPPKSARSRPIQRQQQSAPEHPPPRLPRRLPQRRSKGVNPALPRSVPPRPRSTTAPSPAPSSHPSHAASDDADADAMGSDSEVFCICRKPDDHTWMIACDGGCEDWYHGRCVNMDEENSKVIDKYICPNCEARGKGVTTWLPMCRNSGCRRPARLTRGRESKYCSDACGIEFMRAKAGMGVGGVGGTVEAKGRKARRKANLTDNFHNATDDEEAIEDDNDLVRIGGVLRGRELKVLATTAQDVASFRKLGDGVLSPPATASPEKSSFPPDALQPLPADHSAVSYTLNPTETARIAQISARKAALKERRLLLADRDRFVALVRDQAAREAEREGVKSKDFCGYDARLAWSEGELDRWRRSREGRTALALGTLEGAVGSGAGEEDAAAEAEDADKMDVDGQNWPKAQQHDVNFEKMELAHEVKSLEREEEGIRMRAALRCRKGSAGESGLGLAGEEGRRAGLRRLDRRTRRALWLTFRRAELQR
ncbi:COMPASS (complex proteins associated with Set1p) component [Coniosporium tulheliwenetii]|uniref:COMPASS (Complex proteins associated with Set1p) component n=1 Tax=Coniosporium tulheliwenetii TaxID=3383036 RepID=A0ACC2YQ11_9PEZI|nr:COMPASS (complex proteins associated with Set1p) component [Cladosporium sp. JES 115]